MLRRQQLKTRATAKGKDDGDGEKDGEGKGRGKGKGRKGKGKGRGKGKRSKACEGPVDGDVEGPPKKAKVSEVEAPPLPSMESPKVKGKGKGKGGKGATAKAKPKAKSKAKVVKPTPEPETKSTRKRKTPIPSAPATQDDQDGTGEADPPAVPREPQVMLDQVDSLYGELVRQWKSSKPILKGIDFTPVTFAKSSLSCYYTRSRPAVGLKTKLPTDRSNKEFAYFAFKPQDAMNIGLARECAVRTVSYQLFVHVDFFTSSGCFTTSFLGIIQKKAIWFQPNFKHSAFSLTNPVGKNLLSNHILYHL